MGEELKEVWTTLILPITKFSNNDYYRRKDKGQIESYNDLSEYKPTYLPVGSMGYDGSNKTYRLLKTIKVRNSNGGFDYYMVPEFAIKGVYVDKPKPVVESLSNQATIQTLQVHNDIPPKPNSVAKLSVKKPATPKSKLIAKLPVPLNLLPYIANVSSDGVAFFNIPEGYTKSLFENAIGAVYELNKGLSQKPMVYYEQPQQLILQQKLQQLATLLSLKLYLAQRQLIALLSLSQKLQAILLSLEQKLQNTLRSNIKYNTSNNTQTVEVPVENTGEPDLVTEVFAYPSRQVDVYNIHPEAYLKVLEYLNNNFKKTKTNNKPDKYILSLSGFSNVPIGGEVNDSTFHYISKDGEHEHINRLYFRNANIINKNEPFSLIPIYNDIVIDNGKLKMYSYSNGNNVYFKNSNGVLLSHPFNWNKQESVFDYDTDLEKDQISYLREHGFNELLIKDFINKNKNIMITDHYNNVNRSIFRPVEKKLPTLNNSTLLTNNSGNVVLKVKLTVKLTASKIRSFLGFLNGGQLKYYENLSLLFIPNMHYLTKPYTNTYKAHKKGGILIKKKNKGKFTEYCGGKVTDECIQRAKRSGNKKLIKRAVFALNSRKWKH